MGRLDLRDPVRDEDLDPVPAPSLWFVVPANGRVERSRVCLRQLARTCDVLNANGVRASAVVIADDENLVTAAELGFATVERQNEPLGRKFNDGFQLACDPSFNPIPAEYAVPLGSDDWIDPQLLLAGLPAGDTILCFRQAAFVREDGQRLAPLRIPYDGGIGIRVIPAALLSVRGYRPSDEDRDRAIDTSVFTGITRHLGRQPRIEYRDLHPLQIVDWKAPTDQINSYRSCLHYLNGEESETPWEDLAAVYSLGALAEMRGIYEGALA